MASLKKPYCWVCHRTDFQNWEEVFLHMEEKFKVKSDPHSKNASAKKWAKKYKYRKPIAKLRKIGKNKEPETRIKLTPAQLQAKKDAKYTLSKQTKYVPLICPRCKKGHRDFVDIEHANCEDAARTNGILEKLCERCK